MAAGKRERGGTSSKKREAMSKFGARVQPNDQKAPFEHARRHADGPAKLLIEGKHNIKMTKGSAKPPAEVRQTTKGRCLMAFKKVRQVAQAAKMPTSKAAKAQIGGQEDLLAPQDGADGEAEAGWEAQRQSRHGPQDG